ncbi:MAG: glutamate--tRNA ligase [Dehalococcoidia bacterium]
MTEPNVRVRFAPSPTGYPHVGNIRTALFNWLFARHYGGSFIVRIEDTDQARKVEDALESILDSLRWLGLDWDEGPEVGGDYGPYFQSERLDTYHSYARRLLDEGHAYLCYCPPERLDEMRVEQARRKEPPRYDRRCRNLSRESRVESPESGGEGDSRAKRLQSEASPERSVSRLVTPVVRLKTPLDGQTRFHDLIRGEIVFENSTLDDFVLLKSDGYPTYHLANIVDDHLMAISHIMRADEWLSSTPRHVLLYQAFGWQPPLFAHLPMILGPDKSKLSKRHGATSVTELKDQGYLPEAVLNFLALLGWSLDDHTEILSREELVTNFSIERVSKTGAIFNHEKLRWMNGVYLRELRPEAFLQRIMPLLESSLPQEVERPISEEYVRRIVPLIQERIATLNELGAYTDFFFLDALQYDPSLLVGKKMTPQSTLTALNAAREKLSALESFDTDSMEGTLRPLAEEMGLKTGQLFGVLRVAVTGRTAAPPLFQTMVVLGKGKCLRRIEAAITLLYRLDSM